MANKNSKATLYEMASKAAKTQKSGFGRVEKMPKKTDEVTKKVNIDARLPRVIPQKKPLILSYRRRRNLVTRPLIVVLIALLVLTLVWISGGSSDSPTPDQAGQEITETAISTQNSEIVSDLAAGNEISDSVMDIGNVPPTIIHGDHVIVLAHYITREEFVPVIEYFARNGIETVIEKRGVPYVLITKNRYSNPNKRGTDGYAARELIKKIGAQYKPPRGYKSFNFSSIYGDKVE
jgi:hypothetical protein